LNYFSSYLLRCSGNYYTWSNDENTFYWKRIYANPSSYPNVWPKRYFR